MLELESTYGHSAMTELGMHEIMPRKTDWQIKNRDVEIIWDIDETARATEAEKHTFPGKRDNVLLWPFDF